MGGQASKQAGTQATACSINLAWPGLLLTALHRIAQQVRAAHLKACGGKLLAGCQRPHMPLVLQQHSAAPRLQAAGEVQ
jgi:hypothetical protein